MFWVLSLLYLYFLLLARTSENKGSGHTIEVEEANLISPRKLAEENPEERAIVLRAKVESCHRQKASYCMKHFSPFQQFNLEGKKVNLRWENRYGMGFPIIDPANSQYA